MITLNTQGQVPLNYNLQKKFARTLLKTTKMLPVFQKYLKNKGDLNMIASLINYTDVTVIKWLKEQVHTLEHLYASSRSNSITAALNYWQSWSCKPQTSIYSTHYCPSSNASVMAFITKAPGRLASRATSSLLVCSRGDKWYIDPEEERMYSMPLSKYSIGPLRAVWHAPQ